MRKLLCMTIICLMLVAMFTGCGLLQKLGLQNSDNDELHPVSSIVMNEDQASQLTDKVPIHLYFANDDNTKLKLEVRYIPMAEAKKSVNNLATTIVNELVKGPSSSSGLSPTIPKGAKQGARVKIDAATATATVDFTKDFIEKHTGGKTAEQMTIYSVVNSLTELKEIQKVKFTINGKSQKEFKGSFKFDAAFPRAASLISKSTTPANPDGKQPGTGDKKKDSDTKDKPKESPAPKDKQTSGDDSIIDTSGGLDDTLDQYME